LATAAFSPRLGAGRPGASGALTEIWARLGSGMYSMMRQS